MIHPYHLVFHGPLPLRQIQHQRMRTMIRRRGSRKEVPSSLIVLFLILILRYLQDDEMMGGCDAGAWPLHRLNIYN